MGAQRSDPSPHSDDPWVRWVTFPCEFTAEVILVLDSSASAQPFWEQIGGLARSLLTTLSRELPCSLYFLGNPAAYVADDFARAGASWYRDNQNRASLIGPVFDAVAGREGASVLVLGAGRIFDLEDWFDTPLLGRTRLVYFDEAPLCDRPLCRQESAACLNLLDLAVELDRRPRRIELPTQRAMPFTWDNPAYVWDNQERCLAADRAADFRVRVGLLCEAPEAIRPTAVRTDRDREHLSWRPCDPVQAGDWIDLSSEEAARFRQCVRAGKYVCPHCRGEEHPAERLRCPRRRGQASILGLPIYQALDELPDKGLRKGFVLFRDLGDRVCLHYHSCAALRLPNRAVGMRQGAEASVYRFDPAASEWRSSPGERVQPYHPVGGDTYAVLL